MQAQQKRPPGGVDFKLYVISDRHLHPESDPLEPLRQSCLAGVKAIQLREKDLPARALFELAQRARKICPPGRTRLFINGRVDVAKAVQADGVQLSRHSLPCAAARDVLGPAALIGLSTHSIGEIEAAEREGCDFVLFGPVFSTPSKRKYGPPQGLDGLKEAARATRLPVFAVGGIEPDLAGQCVAAGAHGVAVIRSILLAQNLAHQIARFRAALGYL